MSEIVIRYDTLALSQQVLERQQAHADAIAAYLPANAGIGDSTGLLLSMFDPLSEAAIWAGQQAAHLVGVVEQRLAGAVGDTAVDLADTDGRVGASFARLLGELGGSGGGSGGSGGPDLGGPVLGAAGESAPDGYGEVNSFFWEKTADTVGAVTGAVGDATSLIDAVGQWGGAGPVGEVADASSYLVPGQAPENPVQDLRWTAGGLLGGIDWVAEKFIGFSILDRCVYHPLAGDWQGIFRAGESWSHAGDAAGAIARNHAGLVASTPATWQGESGDAFRTAMATMTYDVFELGAAYGVAAGLVKKLATVCKLACTAIGAALNLIANKLMKMAAEAATPVVGWLAGAVTAYQDIEAVVKNVRLIYGVFETIESAIQAFAEAKTSIMDKLALIEDLAQGAVGSAAA